MRSRQRSQKLYFQNSFFRDGHNLWWEGGATGDLRGKQMNKREAKRQTRHPTAVWRSGARRRQTDEAPVWVTVVEAKAEQSKIHKRQGQRTGGTNQYKQSRSPDPQSCDSRQSGADTTAVNSKKGSAN